MVKQTAFVAALLLLIGGYGATRAYLYHQIYHGSAVNDAVEQRDDRWWKSASAEVSKNDQRFRLATSQPLPKIISRGSQEDKVVALTFDDGPHPKKVEELLALLEKLDVKATFFVVGKMVEKHPELIKMEAADGHEIGDHSFSHVNLSKISEAEVETEYRACSDLILHTIGVRPKFCRPPGGQATPAVMEGAAKNNLITAMWSDDPKDYENPGTDLIAERLMRRVGNGAVILLHEGVDETMEILPALVYRLRAEGYRFVTMSQLWTMSKSSSPAAGFGRVAVVPTGSALRASTALRR